LIGSGASYFAVQWLQFTLNILRPNVQIVESEGHSARKPPRPVKKRKSAYESSETDQAALFEPRRNAKGGNEFS
jgi:hypothetical protein